jgi:hypothetical protein
MLGRLHDAGEVDAGDHREIAHNRRLARDRQAVLVVQAGMRHRYRDVAIHQLVVRQLLEGSGLAIGGFLDQNCAKCHGVSLASGAPRSSSGALAALFVNYGCNAFRAAPSASLSPDSKRRPDGRGSVARGAHPVSCAACKEELAPHVPNRFRP